MSLIGSGAQNELRVDAEDDTPLLVGGFSPPQPEKYEFVNWDDDYSQYMGK